MIQLIFALRRLPSLSREEFQDYWRDHHAPLVRQASTALGIRKYIQNHTVPAHICEPLQRARGTPEAYDGVAELWFDDIAAVTPTGSEARNWARRLFADEKNFIDLAHSPIWISEQHVVFD